MLTDVLNTSLGTALINMGKKNVVEIGNFFANRIAKSSLKLC